MSEPRFWETKSLDELNREEWEALCDGCGRCCLLKIEDEDSGDLYYTNVVCKFHDSERCRCTAYRQRSELVPDCIKVTPEVAREQKWLPDTCAYRLLAEGKTLFDWHPPDQRRSRQYPPGRYLGQRPGYPGKVRSPGRTAGTPGALVRLVPVAENTKPYP